MQTLSLLHTTVEHPLTNFQNYKFAPYTNLNYTKKTQRSSTANLFPFFLGWWGVGQAIFSLLSPQFVIFFLEPQTINFDPNAINILFLSSPTSKAINFNIIIPINFDPLLQIHKIRSLDCLSFHNHVMFGFEMTSPINVTNSKYERNSIIGITWLFFDMIKLGFLAPKPNTVQKYNK